MNTTRPVGVAFVCTLFLSILSTQTHAVLVYEQPWGGTVTGPFSQTQGNIPSNTQEIADNFTALDNWTISGVTWHGSYNGSPLPANSNVSFLLRIYSETNGLPAANPLYEQSVLPTYTATTSTSTLFGYEFSADLLSPFLLQSGSNYWLSIQDDDTGTPNYIWNGNVLGTGDGFAVRKAGAWAASDVTNIYDVTDRAFSLYTVPILPTLWLFGSGLLGLIGITRHKKAA